MEEAQLIYGSMGSALVNRNGYTVYDLNGKEIKNSISDDKESGIQS